VTENAYQAKLIRKLKRMFPDCEVLKNDPNYLQGILDLTILWGPYWAMLEVKASAAQPGLLRAPSQRDVIRCVHLPGERRGGARCASGSILISKDSMRFSVLASITGSTTTKRNWRSATRLCVLLWKVWSNIATPPSASRKA
jgi:hypothetical protein